MRSLILLCVLLAGCVAESRPERRSGPPDGLVVVFADDFHSGIVIARPDAPGELLPAGDARPWTAFHFGERRWITGDASGALAALRLAVLAGEGGMQVDTLDWWVHDRGGTDPTRVRIWVFPVSATALDGLRRRLRAWVAPGAQAQPLRPGTCWWPSAQHWSLTGNCHDFTADVLAGAGILVQRPPIMLADGLRASLDEAWSRQDPVPWP